MYEARITEDVQILRTLINMTGYHRDNWTKHNKSSHNVFTILRQSLKITYNKIDEVGYEFVKMLSKMFGVNKNEEFLHKQITDDNKKEQGRNNNYGDQERGVITKHSNTFYTDKRCNKMLAEKKLKKKEERLQKKLIDKQQKKECKKQRQYKDDIHMNII